MLECMTIDNIALIEHAEINFSDGFSVLTGETGAGKSILIGSMNMLLGERVSKELIRYGTDKAKVQAVFYIKDERTLLFLEKNGFQTEDGMLIVSRQLSVDGKNTCHIGGNLVPVAKLRELGRYLMNIHGQHDNQALLDHTTHIGFLDRFAGKELAEALSNYKIVYQKYIEVKKELAELSMDESEKLRRLDILNYEINELETAELQVGEEAELKQKSALLSNAQNLLSSCGQALDLLYENPDGECAYNYLASAQDLLLNAAHLDASLSVTAENVENTLVTIQETVAHLKNYLDRFDAGEDRLEQIESRLDLIYRLKRKYGGGEAELLATLEKRKEERDSITMMDEKKEKLEKEIVVCLAEANSCADKLSQLREKASGQLSVIIGENLSFLNMPGAKFFAGITPGELSHDGKDKVEFMLSANVGEPPKPLSKIVSGGELSRIMLAIQSVLSEQDAADTLIFDEIDTGVSGRAALKLGEKLRELSSGKQVLCVTHLAQVAAKASQHFLIDKREEENKTLTSITPLDKEGRISELSRLIGGDVITETTKKQAEEMLNG
ncbi:MAG: DNA repair protein RecN [Clostridia bacterium]|nr:DNA repair protein RecN [Clostridia bacterium]